MPIYQLTRANELTLGTARGSRKEPEIGMPPKSGGVCLEGNPVGGRKVAAQGILFRFLTADAVSALQLKLLL